MLGNLKIGCIFAQKNNDEGVCNYCEGNQQ
jgi:hypothetical protein